MARLLMSMQCPLQPPLNERYPPSDATMGGRICIGVVCLSEVLARQLLADLWHALKEVDVASIGTRTQALLSAVPSTLAPSIAAWQLSTLCGYCGLCYLLVGLAMRVHASRGRGDSRKASNPTNTSPRTTTQSTDGATRHRRRSNLHRSFARGVVCEQQHARQER